MLTIGTHTIRPAALQLLLDQVRAGDRRGDDALAIQERMTQLRLRLLGDRVSRSVAWRLANDHGWTIDQAEGIAVAQLQADALVTVDRDFAAQASAVVSTLPLSALEPELRSVGA
jgi:predicted nucleic acid-binding protein